MHKLKKKPEKVCKRSKFRHIAGMSAEVIWGKKYEKRKKNERNVK